MLIFKLLFAITLVAFFPYLTHFGSYVFENSSDFFLIMCELDFIPLVSIDGTAVVLYSRVPYAFSSPEPESLVGAVSLLILMDGRWRVVACLNDICLSSFIVDDFLRFGDALTVTDRSFLSFQEFTISVIPLVIGYYSGVAALSRGTLLGISKGVFNFCVKVGLSIDFGVSKMRIASSEGSVDIFGFVLLLFFLP